MGRAVIGDSLPRQSIRWLSFSYKARRGWGQLTAAPSTVDSQREAFYRTIWEEAALGVGTSVVHLTGSLLEIRSEGLRVRIFDHFTSLDDPVTLRLSGDKPLALRLLREQGIPVPRHLVCGYDDLDRAWSFATGSGSSFVVKPARGTSAGQGVTSGVRQKRSLARAMAAAGGYCPEVVVEEQIEGGNYRLLYLDGELLDAVRRSPPVTRGNGSSSLQQLIAAENKDRMRKGMQASQNLIRIDEELKQTLRTQGYGLRSIPPAGEVVRLRTVVSDNRKEDNHPAMGELADSIVTTCSRAASALGVRLAGVDVITPDPAVPLEKSGGVVIEVNTMPGLHYHYFTSAGGVPVAILILQRLLQNRPVARGGPLRESPPEGQ